MLDPLLFPPEVEYTLGEEFDNDKRSTRRKQVRVHIGTELFAVMNCDYYAGTWHEPEFVILRSAVPVHELCLLTEIVEKAMKIMPMLQNSTSKQMQDAL